MFFLFFTWCIYLSLFDFTTAAALTAFSVVFSDLFSLLTLRALSEVPDIIELFPLYPPARVMCPLSRCIPSVWIWAVWLSSCQIARLNIKRLFVWWTIFCWDNVLSNFCWICSFHLGISVLYYHDGLSATDSFLLLDILHLYLKNALLTFSIEWGVLPITMVTPSFSLCKK